jgi:hypothetical protein
LGSLETSIRLIELVGGGMLLLAVLVATSRRSRWLLPLLVAAAVFGVVFLNPLGVVAKVTRGDPRPVAPVGTADTGVHWVKVLGIPVAWFVPYRKNYLFYGENSPSGALKLRYGLSFLPSTGARTIVSQCSNSITDPCWRDDYPLVQRDSRGRTWLVPLTEAPLGNVSGQQSYIHVPHFYAIRLGLASVEGLAYWVLLLGVAWLVLRARPVPRRTVVAPVVALVVGGVLLNLALAAAATPSRSASSREPQLVPKAPPEPRSTGELAARRITDQHYPDACVKHVGQTTTYFCRGAVHVTAAETGDTVLAVWTAQPNPDFRTQLRVRRLSPSGRPLGPSRLIGSWSSTTPSDPGHGNCHVPTDLQASPLARGRVLVVWSDSCELSTADHASDLVAIVLDRSGRLVRRQSVVAHVPASFPSGSGVQFYLRSTTSGRSLLVWIGKARESKYTTAGFTAFLDVRGRARRINEIVGASGGDLAVACSSRCILAYHLGTSVGTQPQGSIEVYFLSRTGAVTSRQAAYLGSPNLFSHPVAVGVDDRFYVGILTTQRGSAATAFLATFREDVASSIARVWTNVPTGAGSSPGIPEPIGIFGAATGTPTLAWQAGASQGSKPLTKIYLADGSRRSSKSVTSSLLEPMFVGGDGTLVAVGSAGTPFPEAVSVEVPRP